MAEEFVGCGTENRGGKLIADFLLVFESGFAFRIGRLRRGGRLRE